MARNVNVFMSGWRSTGANIQTPQYEETIRIDWIDDTGVSHTQTNTIQFPNFLATIISAGYGVWLQQEVNELLVRAARKYLGID